MCWQRGVPSGTSCTRRKNWTWVLIQPLPFKPVFPEDKDPVSSQYPGAVTGHPAPMNDLGARAEPRPSPSGRRVRRPTCSISTSWTSRCAGAGGLPARRLRAVPGPGSAPSISRSGSHPGPGRCGDPDVRHARDTAPSARRRCGRDQRGAQQPRRGRDNRPRARPLPGSSGSSAGSPGKVRYGPDAKAAVRPSGRVTWQGVAAEGTTRFPAARAGRPGRG